MATRVIPNTENPWICSINGVIYKYTPGTTQTVPDEVAKLIDTINAAQPKYADKDGHAGQVWKRDSNGSGYWADEYSYTLPSASATVKGGVKQGAAVADAAGTAPTAAEFKALLDALRAAGIIATAE